VTRILKQRSLLVGVALGLVAAAATSPGRAATDAMTDLANAICASKTAGEIGAVVAEFAPAASLSQEEVAEAFGEASFMADLGRCASGQAIADAYAAFKAGKDAARLDAAFAMGRVSGTAGGGTAGAGSYDGSYSGLGSAGDPPSGQ
jgi:hypothetical protein